MKRALVIVLALCMILAFAGCMPTAAEGAEGAESNPASTWTTIAMFAVIIVVFYFFIIRPENKKKKKLAEMRNELGVGDQITTIGGMIGVICAVNNDTIVFETGEDRVRIEIAKWAISTKGIEQDPNAKK